MPWMTATEINQCERRRREASFDVPGWRVCTNEDMEQATILVGPKDGAAVERYEFRFDAHVMDLPADTWERIPVAAKPEQPQRHENTIPPARRHDDAKETGKESIRDNPEGVVKDSPVLPQATPGPPRPIIDSRRCWRSNH